MEVEHVQKSYTTSSYECISTRNFCIKIQRLPERTFGELILEDITIQISPELAYCLLGAIKERIKELVEAKIAKVKIIQDSPNEFKAVYVIT